MSSKLSWQVLIGGHWSCCGLDAQINKTLQSLYLPPNSYQRVKKRKEGETDTTHTDRGAENMCSLFPLVGHFLKPDCIETRVECEVIFESPLNNQDIQKFSIRAILPFK